MDLPLENLLHLNKIEFLILDGGLHIVSLSPGAARLALDPQEAVPGNDVRMAFPEIVGAEEALKEVLAGHRASWQVRGICRSQDPSSPLYVDLTVERRRGSDQEPPFIAVMLEDVTSWMLAVQESAQTMNDATILLHALTASKAYIEGILDAMADILIVTTPAGAISAANPAALEAFGYASADLIGLPVSTLLPDEQRPMTAIEGRTRHEQWRSEKVELRCVGADGTTFPVSFSRAPLEAEDGALRGFVYVGRDLRDQRRAEDRISTLETEKRSLAEVLRSEVNAAEIVGDSPPMKELMGNLVRVAATDTTVLITGETGTGKELVAKAVHRLSRRAGKLLVSVNCAGLPAGLVESELFGHEKGAFTGAVQKRIGRFELADGGTVFLDEVAELPPAAQAMLLRALQEQEFERVGGSRPVRVDVRVIAATNRDLKQEVKRGLFRDDLLFRLNVFPLHVPPLRERPGDIALLAEHFLHLFARRANKRVSAVSMPALDALTRYRWPGNVRELANVIERALIVCHGPIIRVSDLALPAGARGETEVTATLDEAIRKLFLQVLRETHGVIEGPQGAASRLGINPATLRSKMKKLGIVRVKSSFQSPHPE